MIGVQVSPLPSFTCVNTRRIEIYCLGVDFTLHPKKLGMNIWDIRKRVSKLFNQTREVHIKEKKRKWHGSEMTDLTDSRRHASHDNQTYVQVFIASASVSGSIR